MARKTIVTLVLAAALAVAGAAFAQPKTVDYPGLGMTPGKVGGTLTLGLADSPPTFLYYGQIDNNTQTLTGVVFDPLVEFNLETYAIEPALAASWDVSPDGTVYTFHLRQGVKWHDGTPFTSADVVFTYTQIIANPEARAGDAAAFVFTVDGEQRPVTFAAPDDSTVVMTLPAPAAAFLLQQRFPMLPKHKLLPFSVEGGAEQADINNAWSTATPLSDVVGTGPFMYDTYVPGQKVGLVRNPNYWKVDAAGTSLPYADRLDYLIVRGNEAQAAQFLAGNLATLNISGAQFPDFKSREVAGADFRVVTSPALFGSPPHLAFNFDDPEFSAVFSDVAFRRAMERAVDRQRIIDDVYNGLAEIPGTPTAPADGTFYEDTKSLMLPFDLTEAGAALDALGIKDTDGNGVRNVPSGKDLEFSLTYNSDSSTYTDMATILQNDFSKIGVKANLVGVQGSALLSTGLAGDYQAIIIALGNQPDPELRKPIWQPGGSLYYWHRSTQPAEPGGPPNFAAMADWEKRIYDIFDQGTTLVDRDARVALYKEWQRINAEKVPVIMIAKPANIAAVHNSVGNFVYNLGVIPGYNPVPLYFVK
ncbi:MAG TPA: ABC transporter substrate-binding protein [Trueperaceae bacterium]|nr:ABC transporter substrate-binding protein [Trueperaceae bacterium]HRQ11096.1 ABC transporter substrate-binding protein [Trueperaceae bacterium]